MQPFHLPEIESAALLQGNEELRQQMRRRCQTDLMFLARVLGYNKLIERVHRPAIDLRVHKNPDLPLEEQDATKQRLHLDPRGIFKTTLSIVDSIQWVICFPNIRICKLTATKPLATAVVGEIAGHFIRDNKSEEWTLFQALFPEFLIAPRDRRTGEFTAPNRTRDWREQTVMAFSIETAISGWHFDVMDPDDVVDTQNSKTPSGIEQVKRNYRINKKTLMPWGYINFNGTRYNPFDLWGDIIDKADPGKIKLLVRSAMRLLDGRRLEPGDFPAEREVELLFPELLNYAFLKQEFEDDYESFMTQYMNDAQGGNEVIFRREELLRATVPVQSVPVDGQVTMAWRLPYSGKTGMRFAGGAVGVIDSGRLYVTNVVRGSFTPSRLAHRIVQLAKESGGHNVVIEETPGARQLEPTIKNYGLTMNWPVTVQWREFQEDDGVRDMRIKSTEPLLASRRLLFAEDISCLREVFKQLANYGMMEEMEVPDVIARLAEAMPHTIAPLEQSAEQDAAWKLAQERDLYDRTHGIGRYAAPQPLTDERPYEPNVNTNGMEPILGGLRG